MHKQCTVAHFRQMYKQLCTMLVSAIFAFNSALDRILSGTLDLSIQYINMLRRIILKQSRSLQLPVNGLAVTLLGARGGRS